MLARFSGLCLTALALVGCASAPLSGNEYKTFAAQWAAAEYCRDTGQMDSGAVVDGMLAIEKRLATKTYDEALLAQETNKYRRMRHTPTNCTNLAVTFDTYKNQQVQQRQGMADRRDVGKAFTDAMPKQTICNRVGTQMFCSSY